MIEAVRNAGSYDTTYKIQTDLMQTVKLVADIIETDDKVQVGLIETVKIHAGMIKAVDKIQIGKIRVVNNPACWYDKIFFRHIN